MFTKAFAVLTLVGALLVGGIGWAAPKDAAKGDPVCCKKHCPACPNGPCCGR